MLNTTFTGAEAANSGDFTVSNDFRKVFLLRDPKSGGSASATTLRATKAVVFASSPTLTVHLLLMKKLIKQQQVQLVKL